jgi:cob(I)alamin adenosyltransferase
MGKVDDVEKMLAERIGPASKILVNKTLNEIGASRTNITDEQFFDLVDILVNRAINDEKLRKELRKKIERLFGVPATYTYSEKRKTAKNVIEDRNKFYDRLNSLQTSIKELEENGLNLGNLKEELKHALYHIDQANFKDAKRILDSVENSLLPLKAGLAKVGLDKGLDKLSQNQQKKEEKTRLLEIGSYIIKSETSDSAYSILSAHIDKRIPSLCLSRTHPQKLIELYNLSSYKELKLVWLSHSSIDTKPKEERVVGIGIVGYGLSSQETENEDEDTIVPTNLLHLSHVIENFMKTNQESTSFVLLDGFEYLVTQNDFSSVLKIIQKINEKVVLCSARFLVPLDPKILSEKELRLLEREMIPL